MQRALPFVLFITLLLPASSSTASCLATAQTQAAMNECANSDFESADRQLNLDYKKIIGRLDAPGQTSFRKAQEAWIKFRDSECEFRSSGVQGGSVYPMVYGECLAELTTKRLADFKYYLTCEEGDLSCVTHP
ncbi:lysozyme inhibitor LprI family protein [Aestuariivirga sp.]|uniref:lysozyme inhibitor LprI family protein n=1 Tax=Aestuariivirga sp. TaxID=2650926 RepID=UPI0039E2EA4A